MSWAEVLSIIVLPKVSLYPGSKMMNKSYLIVDEQTVSRLNVPYYKKIKLCLKIDLVCRNRTLGMQISKFRYANMDFFQNTGYSNTIFGKWLGIQIWISGAFYLSLTLCPVHAVIILQPRVIHPSWFQEKVSVSDSALSLETDLKILICSKPWP